MIKAIIYVAETQILTCLQHVQESASWLSLGGVIFYMDYYYILTEIVSEVIEYEDIVYLSL